MNIIKFMKSDFRLSRSQLRLMLLFIILAVLLSLNNDNLRSLWAIGYICFGSIVLSTTPFCLGQNKSSGFINMVPATTFSRIAGRYLFGLVMMITSAVAGFAILIILAVVKQVPDVFNLPYFIILLSIAIIVNAIQFVILYIGGNLKSQQVLGILRMVPGFVFFFGGTFLLSKIQNYAQEGLKILDWIANHTGLLAGILAITAAFIIVICMAISCIIVERRDME